jgi:hypothetical protein
MTFAQTIKNRINRLYAIELNRRWWIRFYPNPGFQFGKLYWSKARGFALK